MRAGPAQADRAGQQDDAGDRVQHRPSLEPRSGGISQEQNPVSDTRQGRKPRPGTLF